MTQYHHGRQDLAPGASGDRDAHAATDAPEAMVDRLLAELGRRFYAGKPAQRWLQDQKPLLEAITWPAVWLNNRGVGMPAAEYEARMMEIIKVISAHGDLAKIKFFPAYLGDCTRKHFIHHGEEIYEARKSIRNALDLSFLKGVPVAQKSPDAVPTLVAAHAVLATARRAAKIRKTDDLQASLF